MKRIAIIFTQSIENSTSSMIRCRNIVNEYPDLGYEVVCFSPFPKQKSIYHDTQANLNSNIQVIRYGKEYIHESVPTVAKKRGLKNAAYQIAYSVYKKVDLFGSSITLLRYKKQITAQILKGGFDILLTFSDPKTAHIIGGYCKKSCPTLTYIQQWGDPLALDITSNTILPNWIRRFIEASLLKPADRVCYVSPLTFEAQKKLYKNLSHKMFFLPTPCETKLYKKTNNHKITLGYFGSYNLVARDIRPLYQAVSNCPECEFLLVGNSDLTLQEKENVHIIERVSHGEIEKFIEQIDVLVCLLNSKGTQIPGKIYNYAGTNKEILLIKDGDCGDLIEEFFAQYDRFTFVNNSQESILSALKLYLASGVPERNPTDAFRASLIAKQLLI